MKSSLIIPMHVLDSIQIHLRISSFLFFMTERVHLQTITAD